MQLIESSNSLRSPSSKCEFSAAKNESVSIVSKNNFLNALTILFENAQFFLVKSNSENVLLAKANCTWPVDSNDVDKLNEAFRNNHHVVLIIYVARTKKYGGFAIMQSEPLLNTSPTPWTDKTAENCNTVQLAWVSKKELSSVCARYIDVHNDWLDVDTPTNIKNIDQNVAAELCALFPECHTFDIAPLLKNFRINIDTYKLMMKLGHLGDLIHSIEKKVKNITDDSMKNEVCIDSDKQFITNLREMLTAVTPLILRYSSTDAEQSQQEEHVEKLPPFANSCGQIFNVWLGALSDSNKGLFNVIPQTSESEFLKNLDFDCDNMTENVFAGVGDLVALQLNGKFYRAIMGISNWKLKKQRFFLMDTGATEDILMDEVKAFELPDKFAAQLGLAVVCQLENATPAAMDFISDNFYKFHKIKILEYKDDIPIVRLFSTNPFFSSLFDEPKIASLNIENSSIVSEEPDQNTSDENFDELLIDQEEHTNPLMAVMGYIPNDDVRLCPFYREATGDCFKGNHCKLLHMQKNEDGFTKDRKCTITSIPLKKLLPAVGSFVNVVPTHLMWWANVFYGNIQDSDIPLMHELLQLMNEEDVVTNYKSIPDDDIVPLMLVIAPFKNIWYRAKITEVIDKNYVEVRYLDYGNTEVIKKSNLKQWDHSFETVGFQALSFRIANVVVSKTNETQVYEKMSQYLNEELRCEVVLTDEVEIFVKCFDSFGNDIATIIDDPEDQFLIPANSLIMPV